MERGNDSVGIESSLSNPFRPSKSTFLQSSRVPLEIGNSTEPSINPRPKPSYDLMAMGTCNEIKKSTETNRKVPFLVLPVPRKCQKNLLSLNSENTIEVSGDKVSSNPWSTCPRAPSGKGVSRRSKESEWKHPHVGGDTLGFKPSNHCPEPQKSTAGTSLSKLTTPASY